MEGAKWLEWNEISGTLIVKACWCGFYYASACKIQRIATCKAKATFLVYFTSTVQGCGGLLSSFVRVYTAQPEHRNVLPAISPGLDNCYISNLAPYHKAL